MAIHGVVAHGCALAVPRARSLLLKSSVLGDAMSRSRCSMLLALVLAAPVAAQDAGKGPAAAVPPPVSMAFMGKSDQKSPPPGFVFLNAVIDPQRAPATAYPPAGVTVEDVGLANYGTCLPIVRLTVPVERVPEVQALLRSMRPQFTCNDGWCTLKRP